MPEIDDALVVNFLIASSRIPSATSTSASSRLGHVVTGRPRVGYAVIGRANARPCAPNGAMSQSQGRRITGITVAVPASCRASACASSTS